MALHHMTAYVIAFLVLIIACASSASHLAPPVLPLAVRNPYFNYWIQNARDLPWNTWPIFWTGQHVGMSLMASVPGSRTLYPLFGRPHDSLGNNGHTSSYKLSYPYYLGSQFDAFTTNLSYSIPGPSSHAESANLTISFSSPITPTSSLRQSIPASYIRVEVSGSFDIDVYMDVNGDWLSGDSNKHIQWYFQEVGFDENLSLFSWQIQKDQDELFTEFNDRAEWGRLHFTAPTDVRYQSGSASEVRRTFAVNGGLKNIVEQNFRPIKEDEPVFAFHKSFKLGSAQVTNTSSILFTLAHVQDEIVQYASARGLTYMRPLWKSWFNSEYALLAFHYLDYHTATKLASNYSEQLAEDSYRVGGHDYVDITALSARQVLGATSFSGTPDNPLLFLKEISSNGNTQTVDVIFPSFPFFMYTNPRWLAYLLEPLLEHQLSGQYPNKYSMHDLGAHFPNLTGHADGNDEYMPVEECGDMLIMGLSLVNSLQYKKQSEAQSLWSALGEQAELSANKDAYPFPIHASRSVDDALYGLDDQWGGGIKGHKQAEQWLGRSYQIWKQWTQYLVDEALEPANQLCTDDFAGWLPLQTNLALKGIIGIHAMSELANIVGKDSEAKFYKNISTTYVKKWREYGMTRDGKKAKLAYNWFGSWTTLYSLFSDAMLCFHKNTDPPKTIQSDQGHRQAPLGYVHDFISSNNSNLIDHDIYQLQSRHYEDVMQKFGLPLDSRHLYTKSDWQLQSAAVASPRTKTKIIRAIARWLNETSTDTPFSDLFETEGDGGFAAGNHFTARPVVGSHFSLLSLDRACGGTAWTGHEDDSFW